MLGRADEAWIQRLPRVRTVDRIHFLCSMAQGKRVIHVGFSDSPVSRELLTPRGLWLHEQLSRVSRHLVGLDLDERATEWAQRHGYDAAIADCTDARALRALKLPPAELVIAGELIEHVDSPGALLDALHVLIAPQGKLVITTPNAHSFASSLATVARREVINPDHVALYSWYTLTNILERHEWRVKEFLTYQYPGTGTWTGRIAFGLERLASRWSPFVAHGLIAICNQA